MAHRVSEPRGCPIGAAPFVALGLLLALCGAARGCEDIGPAQKPRPAVPRSVPPVVGSLQPVRPGDICAPSGAVRHSNTGVTLTCGRHRGLGYDTWG